ncbi:MAG TPA: UDP-N-acetylmuramoyl-tripeptide--D-alanyl-D-alanine ligase [Rhodocyclaceae bacterium]|nr:UDP-N-acetylmuramoyl-tripeptide--D-alanyl-D-alanine ligase [Rhodocyclaceae bacterium]HRQ47193.1 UDP-N-acetylmuramoyl-tripeptide--D-alanyl-D-alanine ligase [Rhodocyclaceae bacterium]
MMSLQEAANVLGAHTDAPGRFVCVGTDSRHIERGELFVALRGARFDGHDFVDQAFIDGAAGAVVDRRWADTHGEDPRPLIVVEDTRLALGTLAGHWRARFRIPVIGITGSNGKTTVKEMCAAIMRAHVRLEGYGTDTVLATRGNLNNDIGLPLTLLELGEAHRAAVVEMGMNRPGEIAYLAGLARPTVAIVTNAQRAHLQGVGSLQQIAQEKGAIYGGLEAGGVAVINADDPHAGYWRDLNAAHRILSFGVDGAADVSGRCTLHGLGAALELVSPEGHATINLKVPGLHNVRNALGAAAACLAAGATLEAVVDGLAGFSGTRGRLQLGPGLNGATILDDSYNANPDSVRAAIDVLAATPGRKILVLGDMGEIGGTSAQIHDEIGGYAKSKGIDELHALGEMSVIAARNFGEGGRHYGSMEALVDSVAKRLDENTVVLVKGSRFMGMERVADALSAVHNDCPPEDGDTNAA